MNVKQMIDNINNWRKLLNSKLSPYSTGREIFRKSYASFDYGINNGDKRSYKSHKAVSGTHSMATKVEHFVSSKMYRQVQNKCLIVATKKMIQEKISRLAWKILASFKHFRKQKKLYPSNAFLLYHIYISFYIETWIRRTVSLSFEISNSNWFNDSRIHRLTVLIIRIIMTTKELLCVRNQQYFDHNWSHIHDIMINT